MRTRWVLGLAALAALLAAGRAQAFAIVFNGPGGYGISAASAASAEAAGVPIVQVSSLVTAASLNLTIPAPDVLSFSLTSTPSVAHPNTATSQWSVTNSGEGSLSSTWLVFTNPETYTASQVGFEIDGAAGWEVFDLFVPMGNGGTDYFYPAKFLGDMSAGSTVDFLMHHRVGEPLTQQGGVFVLPKYAVSAATGIRPVPEPQMLVVLAAAAALASVVAARRNA